MLVDNYKVDVSSFLDDFQSRFRNFCKKAPLFLSYKTFDRGVNLYQYTVDSSKDNGSKFESKKVYEYYFDYDLSVKANIANIKHWLQGNLYPGMMLTAVLNEEYSVEELNALVSNGKIKLTDISDVSKTIEKNIYFRIEKIISERDEVFIVELDSNEMFRFKMKIPVFSFIKTIFTDSTMTGSKLWGLFMEKSVYLSKVKKYDIDHTVDKNTQEN